MADEISAFVSLYYSVRQINRRQARLTPDAELEETSMETVAVVAIMMIGLVAIIALLLLAGLKPEKAIAYTCTTINNLAKLFKVSL